MGSDRLLDIWRKINLNEIRSRGLNWLSIWSNGRLTEDTDKECPDKPNNRQIFKKSPVLFISTVP
jgi:hypothetical protein